MGIGSTAKITEIPLSFNIATNIAIDFLKLVVKKITIFEDYTLLFEFVNSISKCLYLPLLFNVIEEVLDLVL